MLFWITCGQSYDFFSCKTVIGSCENYVFLLSYTLFSVPFNKLGARAFVVNRQQGQTTQMPDARNRQEKRREVLNLGLSSLSNLLQEEDSSLFNGAGAVSHQE